MEEEFKQQEEQRQNSEEQGQGGPGFHSAIPNYSTVPQYNAAHYYTPYPVYLDPFYRNCGCHGKQKVSPANINQQYYDNMNPSHYNPSHYNPSHHNPSHHNPSHYHQQMYQEMNPGHQQQLYDFCRRYQHHLVRGEGTDGRTYDGIIESMDNENVYMLMPDGDNDWDDYDDMDRQFYGYPEYDYGYPGYDYGFPSYGYPRRFRRFRRRRFPFFFFRRFFFPPFY
ncbi:hypothetical protein [Virgibacillus sediminis]|uniref:Spore coat protein n=1 Tax=Virgibacillus sediminis TaxID=202260 RepID=A0ABV7A9T4_9BACI